MTKMLTVKEVAEQMGVSIHTVYRLANQPGGLRAYRIGSCIRFYQTEVAAYIEEQVIKTAQRPQGNKPGRLHYVPGMRVV